MLGGGCGGAACGGIRDGGRRWSRGAVRDGGPPGLDAAGDGREWERHDYQPFGIELLATSGSVRAGIPGYGTDTVSFEGKVGEETVRIAEALIED